ncbi:hypothetical protein Bca52824_073903 [Brassica carinata]|uniref:Uncharacterized protein n=1 Tax=Brassica carinata TaxID=52824 RepID=A0A8X7QAQ5_BRACI|nr:hypothetical protein Bca52824_073903 [Brassica carinata]
MDSPTRFAAQDYAAKYERIDVEDWESVGSSNSDDGHGKNPLSFILTPTKDLSRQVSKFKEALSLSGALNRTLSNLLVTSTTGIHVSGTQEIVL